MARRLQALTGPLWVQAMTALITGHKYFRWHDSGDLQGAQHLKNIFEVCKNTPDTKSLAANARAWAPVPDGPDCSSKEFNYKNFSNPGRRPGA